MKHLTPFQRGAALGLTVLLLIAAAAIPVGPEYDTLNDLLAHRPPQGIPAKWYSLKGRDFVGDGFAGEFFWKLGATDPTNYFSVFDWAGGKLIRVSSTPPVLNIMAFGAKPTPGLDNYRFITNALYVANTNGSSVYGPPGIYEISQSIVMPSRTTLYGDAVDLTYVGAIPRRFVIQATGNFDALKTLPTTNMLSSGEWTYGLNIHDVYVKGPFLQATAPATGGIGLNIQGCYSSKFDSIHIEGFSTSFLFENTAEIKTSDLFAQNSYNGAIIRRLPASVGFTYDSLTTLFYLTTINNVKDLILDNPRFIGVIGGVNINNLTNLVSKIEIVKVQDDSQIHFDFMEAIESQALWPKITIDTNGCGLLTISHSNMSIDPNKPMVESYGYVDRIKISDCQVQRAVITNHCPIVWLHSVTNSAGNGYLRKNEVILDGLHPFWFDVFVRNDQGSSRPENDYVPEGYENINVEPNTGSAGMDGVISIAGDYAYTQNSICGIAKVFWQNVFTNNVYTLITKSNLTRGIDHIFVTATYWDNDGDNVAVPNVQGWGTQGIGWNRVSQGKIGEYTNTVTGRIFSKWAWCITLLDPSQAQNGLQLVQLFDIYGTTNANRSEFGLERMCVYAPRQKNPYGPRVLTHSAKPSTGLEGFHTVGDIYLNDCTITTQPTMWVCIGAGNPGIWADVNGFTLPDIFGTINPGVNIAANYWRGFNFSPSWPISAGTIRSAASTDQYFMLNGYLFGGNMTAPTFFGSPSGGNFMRSKTSGALNDSQLEFGFFPAGSGTTPTVGLQIAPGGSVVVPFDLSVLGTISTPLFSPTAVNTSTLTTTNGINFLTTNAVPGNTNAARWVKIQIEGVNYAIPASIVP